MMNDVFLSLDHRPFLALSGLVRTPEGVTSRRFRKEVIKVGQYVKVSDNLEFGITPATLSHWAETFHEMRKNGVKVPIPVGHSDRAEDNRGWVEDMFVEGDALVMACELFDANVDTLAATNDVSILSPPEWTDGRGNRYERPIRHIALTPVPVVPGLDMFRPIAASFKQRGIKMDLKKLGADIGITDELTDKNAEALILSHVAALKKAAETATVKANEAAAKLKEAGAGQNPQQKELVSPLVLSLARKNRAMMVNALVSAGKLAPHLRDKIKARKIDADAVALELSSDAGDDFDFWCGVIAENDPVKLGEQTGAQTTVALSDPNRSDEDAGKKWEKVIKSRNALYATA